MADYLFKFGNYIIPMTAIAEDGYDIKPNQRQDLDPYTDQKGITHRNALSHTKTEISITLRDNLSWEDFKAIVLGITGNYRNYNERDAMCEYLDMETYRWKTGHMYLESSQAFKIHHFRGRMKSVTLTFVEY